MATDNLFIHPESSKCFEFNADVAEVFDDMLNRSVPFYSSILNQITELSSYVVARLGFDAMILDLGCSTGALCQCLIQKMPKLQYVGVDSSEPMIQKANRLASSTCGFEVADIRDWTSFSNVGVIVCNLVLQFVSVEERRELIHSFYNKLPTGGALIIVEKIHQENSDLQDWYHQMFRQFKCQNGYSMQEVLNKEQSIEGVLTTTIQDWYINELNNCGFNKLDVFFKWCNFVGIIAIK